MRCWVVLLAACGAVGPTDVAPTPIAPGASLEDVAPPADLACVVRGVPADPMIIRLAASSLAVASVHGVTAADVELPTGEPRAGAQVTIRRPGVELHAVVAASDLHLYPSRRMVLFEVVEPWPEARMHWLSGEPGELSITLELPQHLHLHGTDIAELPCEAVRLERTRFDASARDGEPATILAGTFDLRADPRGSVVARLVLGTPEVGEILAREGSLTKVAIPLDPVTILAWIPSTSVRREDVGGLGLRGTGRGGGGIGGRPLRCPHEVTLYAFDGENLGEIGRVLPEAPIWELGVSAELGRPAVRLEGVTTRAGALLLVDRRALQGCR